MNKNNHAKQKKPIWVSKCHQAPFKPKKTSEGIIYICDICKKPCVLMLLPKQINGVY